MPRRSPSRDKEQVLYDGPLIVWRPRTLGIIVAERALKLERPRRRTRIVSLKFGQPVRSPRPQRGDPWWCPLQITGLGKRRLKTIPGEDSLQALILALEFVHRVLPTESQRADGRLHWFGDYEDLVFGFSSLIGHANQSLQNCVDGLVDSVEALEKGGSKGRRNEKQLINRPRALIASGGHTSDPGILDSLSGKQAQRLSLRSSPPTG